MEFTFNRAGVDTDLVPFQDHIPTSDDYQFEERQDELDELKAQLAEWDA